MPFTVTEYTDGSCCCPATGTGSPLECCSDFYPLPNFLPATVPFCVSETVQPGTAFEATYTWGGTATLVLLAPASGKVNWYQFISSSFTITGPGAPAPGDGFTSNTINGFVGCSTASVDDEGHYVPPRMFFAGIINHDVTSLHVEDRFDSTSITPTINQFVCNPFCFDGEGDFVHASVGLTYDFHMRVTLGTCATWCSGTGTGTGTICPCISTFCATLSGGDDAADGKYNLAVNLGCDGYTGPQVSGSNQFDMVINYSPPAVTVLTITSSTASAVYHSSDFDCTTGVGSWTHFSDSGGWTPPTTITFLSGTCVICDCSVTGSMIVIITGGPPDAAGTYTLPPAGEGFPCVWTVTTDKYTITLFKAGDNWRVELDGAHGLILQWESTDLCATWTILVDDFGDGGSVVVSRG